MKKKVAYFALFIVLLFGLTGCSEKEKNDYEKTINSLEERIIKLEDDNKKLGDKIIEHDSKFSEIERLNNDIKDLESKIDELELQKNNNNLNQIEKKISEYKKQIDKNKEEIDRLSKYHSNNNKPSPTPTVIPTATPVVTPTATPTVTPTPTPNESKYHTITFVLDDGDKLFHCYGLEIIKKEYTLGVKNGNTYGIEYGYENKLLYATKKNVLFNGWYTEKNGKGTRIKASTVVDLKDNITVYPYWVEKDASDINKDEDYINPSLTIKKDTVRISSNKEIDEAIRNNVIYSDDRDPNPKMEYEFDLENANAHSFNVLVTVTDYNNNAVHGDFTIYVDSEMRMIDGKWITYDEFNAMKDKVQEVCVKHNFMDSCDFEKQVENGVGYEISISTYNIYMHYRLEDEDSYQSMYCYYDMNLNDTNCGDTRNDRISHNLMPEGYKTFEKEWLVKVKEILDDIKKETGYGIDELNWDW